ncbi:ABC transporter substrate-binding protein [Streptomyces sp. NPDC000594]|uniref:ABC transporter substrate-binding protein n=1 Tax=Streptomyces sp. NPDC000594 TaxID=3154261 RepID=UPI003326B2C9
MSTGAGVDVQRRLEVLVRDFRSSRPPMPVVVLHAEDSADEDRVVSLVGELYAGHDAHGSRSAVAPLEREGPTEVRRAAGLVRDLGDPGRWDGRRSLYRRYSFPRLRLVRAIEDAVGELGPDWPRTPSATGVSQALPDPAQTLLDQLARQRWRPRGESRWSARLNLFDMAHILPASLVAVLAALLARTDWSIALATGAGFLLLLLLLDNVLPGRAPIFLWLRRESRWFMTTTFLRAASPGRPTDVSLLRPVRSWNAIAARAHDVAEALRTGDDFQLQLYVLALCEDLRDNHRRWSWDLRGFKRPRPPVLFLPRADAGNGGIELIKAVSDVRSRRSELDPLMIVASVRVADVDRLQRSAISEPGTAPWSWYQEWGRSLRAGQSPSRALSELPWVIKVPLPSGRLVPPADGQRHCVKAVSRPTAARVVWSLHTFVLVVAVLVAGVGLRADELRKDYCSASLFTANRDTVRAQRDSAPTECIGIATGDVRFADWLPEGGKAPRRDQVPWTVRALEQRIRTENAKVLAEHPGNYVTLVYAGPLSASSRERASPVKGIEELAGISLAQSAINDNNTVQLRVLVANGGVDMRHQVAMAHAIARYAREDRTVVGVVGAGRDLRSSRETARILQAAELPVVSGTNSATYLPREFANWFSLAATDEWQVEQLGLIARQLRTAKKRQYALVLARDTEKTDDLYTDEQAKYGETMLRKRGFSLLPERRYEVKLGRPALEVHTERFCRGGRIPSVIYFAGRVEDVPPLMSHLNTEEGCARRQISILTGDDLSKADFSDDGQGVTAGITLYHAALARLAPERTTLFYRNAAKHLRTLGMRSPVNPANPALASGQTALAHDAAQALYRAASRGGKPQRRAATWVNLRTVRLWGMATGTIDFTGAHPYRDRRGHSIVLNQVRGADDGAPLTRVLCDRSAGDARPLTVGQCRIGGSG